MKSQTTEAKALKALVRGTSPAALGREGSKRSKVITKKPEPKAERKATISSVARDMILAGKTNEQVLEALHKKFNLDLETKKHYAGWFRAQLVRDGELSKKAAAATRH